MNKICPLLSYNFKILGIVSISIACILIGYSLVHTKIDENITVWLICFGLFCIGYRKEKDEKVKFNTYQLFRYHSLRISFALTTVVVLISSFSYLLVNKPVKISSLYALLFLCLSYNCIYFISKKIDNIK
jgi:hypothetical protein